MSEDDYRPDFNQLAKALPQFQDDATKSIQRQVEKQRKKLEQRPDKFCDICEATFDYRDKPLIVVFEDHEPPIKQGRCDSCKKEISNGFVAVKMMVAEPEVIWVRKTGKMESWPDLTVIKDKRLFEALKSKVSGSEIKEEDSNHYEQKLQNKDEPKGSS